MHFLEALKSIKFKRDTKYSLIGSEEYFKKQFILEVLKENPNLGYKFFYPPQADDAYEIINSDLFGPKVLVFYDFDLFGVEDPDKLFTQTPHFIIAVISEEADIRTKKVSKTTNTLPPVVCNKMREYGDDYPLWISHRITSAGYSIEDGVDSLIYSLVGPNLFSIDNEIKKISFYKETDKHITLEDVQKVTSAFSSKTCYDLLDSILRFDIPGALGCFYSYSKTQDNLIGVVAFLEHYIEKMFRIILLSEKSTPPDDIADILGIPKFIFKLKYYRKALDMGKIKMEKIYDALCDLDLQLRSFIGDKNILIENFILGLKNI